MSKQEQSDRSEGRSELPIERGFPVERVNEIAEKESHAKQWYRPIYTMHKWWARRPGCLFRTISMYSLLNEHTTVNDVAVYEPARNQQTERNRLNENDLVEAIGKVDMDDPELLWDFYPKDIRIKDKKILDPFMGGGTSLVEASRFDIDSVGVDLNPVAWFVTKKELDAGQTDIEELEDAFTQVKEDVAEEILQYYQTSCPNGEHNADVMYSLWVKELDCVACGHTVPLFTDYRIAAGRYENDDKYNVLCPDCGSIVLVDEWQKESSCTVCKYNFNPKDGNVTQGGYYNCPECGQKISVTEGVRESGSYDTRLYAIEYCCDHCEQQGKRKSECKGYKKAKQQDKNLFKKAKEEWNNRQDLNEFVPSQAISKGAKTVSSEIDGPDVFEHGYEKWIDMFNYRQLLCLSSLMKSISEIDNGNAQEYLLLAVSESLRYTNMMSFYNPEKNLVANIFKGNNFGPPQRPVENNVWGAKYGTGNFTKMWDMIIKGVEYAKHPTERRITPNGMKETPDFSQPIGKNTKIQQKDMRNIHSENEYDAVITDPPYYDNIIYSELSDYFYVWQKIILEDRYSGFSPEETPRAESIVTNPYYNKTAEDFEHEMGEVLDVINTALKDDGVLSFTYHHSSAESWGELLESLCDNNFEITATYPINSDLNKFISGEAVAFDIVIVARPTENRQPISWDSLRRRIVRTARETRTTLEENRELASGDIGVIEMGKCFQEYSKHHGEVYRAGNIMSASKVVDEIYGIIQDNDRGEQDVYRDLLQEQEPTYDALNKHLKRSDASEKQMKEMQLFRTDGNDFVLCQWDDEKRQAYVQDTVEESDGNLTNLDKAHFLRYRFEQGKSVGDYLERWNEDELQALCEGLAEMADDETYLKMIGVEMSLSEFNDG
ncbi:DUF1156 domain-containing protein [Halocatena pleomorpha]|uniref:DUF1156 domain-containing protein n=1 Tax=Halocatena pleomorpha TaxID=1785090 RepID=A0A3P3RFW9_9EURY|nr:DUF1156 domain-containing protein [Halocatena pleomorpha]RRJ31849.1 DUF1156 domain-containing protein [Halocatena pleomorpha]